MRKYRDMTPLLGFIPDLGQKFMMYMFEFVNVPFNLLFLYLDRSTILFSTRAYFIYLFIM